MPIDATVMTNVKAERVRRTADLASRKHRERSGRFLIEGPQAVREAGSGNDTSSIADTSAKSPSNSSISFLFVSVVFIGIILTSDCDVVHNIPPNTNCIGQIVIHCFNSKFILDKL